MKSQARRLSASFDSLKLLEMWWMNSAASRDSPIIHLIAPLTVLLFTVASADHSSQVRQELVVLGQSIGPLDTLIAGHALEHQLTLVTGNAREFSSVNGFRLENWTWLVAGEVALSAASCGEPAVEVAAEDEIDEARGVCRAGFEEQAVVAGDVDPQRAGAQFEGADGFPNRGVTGGEASGCAEGGGGGLARVVAERIAESGGVWLRHMPSVNNRDFVSNFVYCFGSKGFTTSTPQDSKSLVFPVATFNS
jgi:hypothetical protein